MASFCLQDLPNRLIGNNVTTLYPETLDELVGRWTALIAKVNLNASTGYPKSLCMDVRRLIRQTDQMVRPDSFEEDIINTASLLAEGGDLKLSLFKLHELLEARLT